MHDLLSRWLACLAASCFLAFVPGGGARADSLLLVDVHQMPLDCLTPKECIEQAEPLMTNILSLSRDETSALTRVLNSSAVVRGLHPSATSGLCRAKIPKELHELPKSDRPAALVNHPGVYFDSARLDGTDATADFAGKVRDTLKRIGLKIWPKEGGEATPGRPTLSVSYSARKESEGCIIPFSVAISIKEEVVLVRDLTLKTSATVWAASARQNLANLNYTHQSALNELLEKFVKDYQKANPA